MTLGQDQIVRRWKAISSVASVGVASATAAFRPPPIGNTPALIALGALVAALSSGLLYVAMLKYGSPRYLYAWIVAALLGTAGALASHYTYTALWESHVATYSGQQRVVGDEFTPDGEAWVKHEGTTDPSQLLFDAGGVAERIWTPASIARVKAKMRLLYYAAFPAVAFSILATLQAVHSASQNRKRGRVATQVPHAEGPSVHEVSSIYLREGGTVLTGAQYQRLTSALTHAFPSTDALSMLVRYKFDANLADFVNLADPLSVIAFNLIQQMEARGWLAKFVAAARDSNPENLELCAIAQELGLSGASPDDKPLISG
jgi:Effector-associated domain 1